MITQTFCESRLAWIWQAQRNCRLPTPWWQARSDARRKCALPGDGCQSNAPSNARESRPTSFILIVFGLDTTWLSALLDPAVIHSGIFSNALNIGCGMKRVLLYVIFGVLGGQSTALIICPDLQLWLRHKGEQKDAVLEVGTPSCKFIIVGSRMEISNLFFLHFFSTYKKPHSTLNFH